jgi:protein-disulfide isomerase
MVRVNRNATRIALSTFALSLLATGMFAADTPPAVKSVTLDAKTARLVQDSLPTCSAPFKMTTTAFDHSVPPGMKASVITIESERNACQGQYLAVTTGSGSFYLGQPWFLDELTGTREEKLKAFAWRSLQETYTPIIAKERTPEGLFKVELVQTTERGKLPLEGEIDADGTVFFFGHFRGPNVEPRAARVKAFDAVMPHLPARGPANAKVSVVEFSDFECPSCKFAATAFKPVLDKYADKIRYIRYDLPLVNNHPWAFAAALAGRAVYRQKPEAFWEYKKQIYENQSQLNAFAIDDFARGFASDHELDMKKYDADLADAAIQSEIMKGVGLAFSNDIRATPTYMVNGILVDPGDNGTALDKLIAEQLAK